MEKAPSPTFTPIDSVKEIKRLRRALKIHKGSEEERAAVRERVRKSRERQRAEWNYEGSIH